MSLKFGIYLVEQRIISPEQFCGLVKIQQEATMSLATIALRKNILTIKQVARVLDLQESNPNQSFIQISIDEDLMDSADADLILHEQQMSCPTIQRLVVECGLLTQHQSTVLFNHFEKMVAKQAHEHRVKEAAQQQSQRQPEAEQKSRPRQPKFIQRPVVVQPYMSKVQP